MMRFIQSYKTPLLFKSEHGLEWREVLFNFRNGQRILTVLNVLIIGHETIFSEGSFQGRSV